MLAVQRKIAHAPKVKLARRLLRLSTLLSCNLLSEIWISFGVCSWWGMSERLLHSGTVVVWGVWKKMGWDGVCDFREGTITNGY